MGQVRHRLARLEKAMLRNKGCGQACPDCGRREGAKPTLKIIPAPVVRNMDELVRLERGQDTSKDVCKTCGKRRVFRIPAPRIDRLSEA
jgi:DNA-directed RNA polymerase subunit RPC12/RpoP